MVDPCPTSSPEVMTTPAGAGAAATSVLPSTGRPAAATVDAVLVVRDGAALAPAVPRRDCGTTGAADAARRRRRGEHRHVGGDRAGAPGRAPGRRAPRGRAHRRGRAARRGRRAGHRGAAARPATRPTRGCGCCTRARRPTPSTLARLLAAGSRLTVGRHRRTQGRRLGRPPPTRRARHPGDPHGSPARRRPWSARPTRGSTTAARTCSPSAPTACSCAGRCGHDVGGFDRSFLEHGAAPRPRLAHPARRAPGRRRAGRRRPRRRHPRRRAGDAARAHGPGDEPGRPAGARTDGGPTPRLRQVALARCSPLAAPFLAGVARVSAVAARPHPAPRQAPPPGLARAGRRHRPAAPGRHDGRPLARPAVASARPRRPRHPLRARRRLRAHGPRPHPGLRGPRPPPRAAPGGPHHRDRAGDRRVGGAGRPARLARAARPQPTPACSRSAPCSSPPGSPGATRSRAGALSASHTGLAGGELRPVTTDSSGLWHAFRDAWHGAGLGTGVESGPAPRRARRPHVARRAAARARRQPVECRASRSPGCSSSLRRCRPGPPTSPVASSPRPGSPAASSRWPGARAPSSPRPSPTAASRSPSATSCCPSCWPGSPSPPAATARGPPPSPPRSPRRCSAPSCRPCSSSSLLAALVLLVVGPGMARGARARAAARPGRPARSVGRAFRRRLAPAALGPRPRSPPGDGPGSLAACC